MPDRAYRSDEKPADAVVDLDADDRWAARLAEARARREVALREKAAGKALPKRRPMPWEEEAEDDAPFKVQPLIVVEEKTDDRVDFADRVDALREARDADKSASDAPSVISRAMVDRLYADDGATGLYPTPPLLQPSRRDDGLVAADAPNVHDIAVRQAAALAAAAPAVAAPEPQPLAAADVADRGKPVYVRNRPRGMALFLIALAALPFTNVAPPLEKGPAAPPAPRFGLVPALGLTTSMLWRPGETVSGEWHAPSLVPPGGPLAATFVAPAAFVRDIAGLQPYVPPADTAIAVPVAAQAPGFATGGPGGLFQPEAETAPPAKAPVIYSPVPRPRPAAPAEPENLQVDGGLGSPQLVSEDAPAIRLPNLGEAVAPDAVPGAIEALPAFEAAPAEAAPVDAAPESVTPAVDPDDALNVTILVPSTTDAKIAQALSQDLEQRGHSVSRVKEVDLSITSRNLRYFHETDRDSAARLAEAYEAELKDFTWFEPKPASGVAEIWLSGDGAPAVVAQPQKPRAVVQPKVVQALPPQPQVIIVRKKPQGLFSRIFSGSGRTAPTGSGGSDDSGTSVVTAPESPPIGLPTTPTTGGETGGDTGGDTGGETGGSTGGDPVDSGGGTDVDDDVGDGGIDVDVGGGDVDPGGDTGADEGGSDGDVGGDDGSSGGDTGSVD